MLSIADYNLFVMLMIESGLNLITVECIMLNSDKSHINTLYNIYYY